MCWGIYLAIPDGTILPLQVESRSPDDDASLHAWRVDNPWIPLAFGESFRSWIVGHAKYCSCGCVKRTADDLKVVLSEETRRYIAEIADSAGQVAAVVHWTSMPYEREELSFDIAGTVLSNQLRNVPGDPWRTDEFYWVLRSA